MLSQSEKETLTRIGRGTPAGDLLRRYWHPVAVAADLTEEKPIKAIKILGEKLVVFRMAAGPNDAQPRYGMVAEPCPTVGRRSPTAASIARASGAPITAGSLPPTAAVSKRQRSRPKAP